MTADVASTGSALTELKPLDRTDGGGAGTLSPVVIPPASHPLQALRHALAEVHAYLPNLTGDINALVAGHQQLGPLRNDLSTLIRDIEAMVVEAAGKERRVETPDGLVEIRTSTKRSQWRSRDLLKQLVMDALSDSGGMEDVWEVLTEVLPLTASLGWRVGALRDHGITPDEWCVEERGHKTAQITGRQR